MVRETKSGLMSKISSVDEVLIAQTLHLYLQALGASSLNPDLKHEPRLSHENNSIVIKMLHGPMGMIRGNVKS